VLIQFDALLNPATESILTFDILNMGPMSKQVWPQSSGISVKAGAGVWNCCEDFLGMRECYLLIAQNLALLSS